MAALVPTIPVIIGSVVGRGSGSYKDVVLRKPLVIGSLCEKLGDVTCWKGKGSSCIPSAAVKLQAT
jgi:hypothetical protein